MNSAVCVCVCDVEEKTDAVNTELLINVTCVSWLDQQRSKLSVWISWRLPASSGDNARWHSIIEVANERGTHLDYIAETDSDHKRLHLPVNQLFDIRVCLSIYRSFSLHLCLPLSLSVPLAVIVARSLRIQFVSVRYQIGQR